jgi:hypothetical protein
MLKRVFTHPKPLSATETGKMFTETGMARPGFSGMTELGRRLAPP